MQGITRITSVLTRLRRVSSNSGMRLISSAVPHNFNEDSASHDLPKLDAMSNEAAELIEHPKMTSLVEVTSRIGIHFDSLLGCLKVTPELLKRSSLDWERCFNELKTYGFSNEDFLRMITNYPKIFKIIEKDELGMAMAQWMNCQLGYNNMLDLLAAQPHFLSLPAKELSLRIPLLQSLAKSRGKNLTTLLRSCPDVLFENWKLVEARVKYVENVMKIDTNKQNLSKCFLFNRSLEELRIRHMFLLRAGIYITPGKIKGTKEEQEQQPWSKNPKLSKITDLSDTAFLSKVAPQLTMEELEVFREMYKEELDNELDDDLSDSECQCPSYK